MLLYLFVMTRCLPLRHAGERRAARLACGAAGLMASLLDVRLSWTSLVCVP